MAILTRCEGSTLLTQPGPCGVGLDVQTRQPGTLTASRGTESKDFGSLGATAGPTGCGVRILVLNIRFDIRKDMNTSKSILISLKLTMHYHLENPPLESRTFRDAPGIQLCIQDSKRQRTPGLNKCVVRAHGDTLGRMKSDADFDTFSHKKLDQSRPPCTIKA